MPNAARRLINSNTSGQFMNRFVPKRNFNHKFDSFLERALAHLPQGNIAYLIVALNCFFYGLYLFWPKYSMHSYMNNFNFSLYALNKGYLWSMFTCHFAHDGFFGTLIDSVILFLLSGSVAQMNGQLFLAKCVILSMFMGNFLLFAYHNSQGGMVRPFHGNDAILRGVIFALIF